jgi:nucleoside-diphosphate-sugar epimerase
MAKILITGADSFVGKNFIGHSKYKDVKEISLFDNKPEDIDFNGVDVVIHLAAIVHQSKRIHEDEYFKINRDLCIWVAKSAKRAGVNQFIFLSTFKVYGNIIPNSMILNEDSPCFPTDSYGKSKHEAELALSQMEDPNFIISIIRTPLVYGDGVKANMLSLLKLVDIFPILPFGKVNNNRSYTFVENLVGFIDKIIERKASGIFITMDEHPLSTTELVKYISKYFEKKVYLFRMPDVLKSIGAFLFPGMFNRLFGSFEFDNHKTLDILDFKPPYPSETGIKKMVIAYRKMKEKKGDKK